MWVYLYTCGYAEKYHICGLKVGVGIICGCPLYVGIYGSRRFFPLVVFLQILAASMLQVEMLAGGMSVCL